MSTAQNLANLSQVYTAGPLSHRNRFINGCMRVSQRGSVALPSNGITYSAADRWYVYTQSAATNSFNDWACPVSQNALRVPGVAGNASLVIGQKIESANIADLAGKQITISGWVSTPVTTVPTVVLYYPTNTKDDFSAVTVISSSPILSSITPSSWNYFSFTTTLPTQVTNGLKVEFAFGAITSGTVAIGGMQLEAGPVATNFEIRPFGYELALCQRYYQSISTSGAAFNGVTTSSNTAYSFGATLFVPMRIGPTCSLTGTWSLTAPAGPSGTVSVVAQTNCNYYLQASGGTYTAGQTCYFGSTVGSSINLSAEL